MKHSVSIILSEKIVVVRDIVSVPRAQAQVVVSTLRGFTISCSGVFALDGAFDDLAVDVGSPSAESIKT
jgi:hypothetical protein